MKIAVAGGTGLVGKHVVEAARERDHEVVLLTRGSGVDLVTGEEVDRALEGVDAAIETLNVGTPDGAVATEFFRAACANLLRAARTARIGHIVALSIVGIDRNPHGYYAGKLAQEEVYTASDAPWTILRATQFHEFAMQMFRGAKAGPLHLAPRARTQPIAAREVGEHLVRLAEQPAQGFAADLAGPREEQLADMTKRYARAVGYRWPVLAVNVPGDQWKGMRAGLNLPEAGAVLGTQTFDEWLESVRP
ncbi:MAG TPA: NAD(P)H-binding protein [Microbacterium sp.]|nr:NAD(P)H-binding protein [Microbacterium sp.]